MKQLTIFAVALSVAGTAMIPATADAQRSHRRTYAENERVYRGSDGRYHKCSGGNGAVGTVAGGAGGALVGNALGGGTLGTIAGGVGGALLGRHLDKQNTKKKNGC